MKRIIFTSLYIVLSLLSFSQTSQVNSDLAPYMFDVGSFWVYQQDGTNTIDSLVQTQLVHDSTAPVYANGNLVLGPVEYFQMHYESKTLNYTSWDHFIGYVIVQEGVDWGNDGPVKLLSSYQIGDSADYSVIKDTLGVFTIGSHQFYEVTKVLSYKQPVLNNQPAYYYYAKDVGMIRKELLDSSRTQVLETWNLINWQALSAGLSTPEEKMLLNAKFYPNPTSGILYLDIPSAQNHAVSLKVFDQLGRLILSQEIETQQNKIELSQHSSGIYFIEIHSEDAIRRMKIVKI